MIYIFTSKKYRSSAQILQIHYIFLYTKRNQVKQFKSNVIKISLYYNIYSTLYLNSSSVHYYMPIMPFEQLKCIY